MYHIHDKALRVLGPVGYVRLFGVGARLCGPSHEILGRLQQLLGLPFLKIFTISYENIPQALLHEILLLVYYNIPKGLL